MGLFDGLFGGRRSERPVRRWDGSTAPRRDPWARNRPAERYARQNRLRENAWWGSESETWFDMGQRSPRDRPDGTPGTFGDMWRERAQEQKEMGWLQRWLHKADPPRMR